MVLVVLVVLVAAAAAIVAEEAKGCIGTEWLDDENKKVGKPAGPDEADAENDAGRGGCGVADTPVRGDDDELEPVDGWLMTLNPSRS